MHIFGVYRATDNNTMPLSKGIVVSDLGPNPQNNLTAFNGVEVRSLHCCGTSHSNVILLLGIQNMFHAGMPWKIMWRWSPGGQMVNLGIGLQCKSGSFASVFDFQCIDERLSH
jgi:hypothetical protein